MLTLTCTGGIQPGGRNPQAFFRKSDSTLYTTTLGVKIVFQVVSGLGFNLEEGIFSPSFFSTSLINTS